MSAEPLSPSLPVVTASSVLRERRANHPERVDAVWEMIPHAVKAIEENVYLQHGLLEYLETDVQFLFCIPTRSITEGALCDLFFPDGFEMPDFSICSLGAHYERINSGVYQGWFLRCENFPRYGNLALYLCEKAAYVGGPDQIEKVPCEKKYKEFECPDPAIDQVEKVLSEFLTKIALAQLETDRCHIANEMFTFLFINAEKVKEIYKDTRLLSIIAHKIISNERVMKASYYDTFSNKDECYEFYDNLKELYCS